MLGLKKIGYLLISVLSFNCSLANNAGMKPVYIALKQPNSTVLYNKLQDISNPLSKNYGQWLSTEEIDLLILSISDMTANKNVLEWLHDNHVTRVHNNGDSIKFIAIQHKINNLFNITGNKYYIPSNGIYNMRNNMVTKTHD